MAPLLDSISCHIYYPKGQKYSLHHLGNRRHIQVQLLPCLSHFPREGLQPPARSSRRILVERLLGMELGIRFI